MQLRLHPNVIALKERVNSGPKDQVYDIQLTYHTPRGNWYHHSWKGDMAKSGGIKLNIGVHFFDMLAWIFGAQVDETITFRNETTIRGRSVYNRAMVKWDLSIDHSVDKKRALLVNDTPVDFTEGFEELHKVWYKKRIDEQYI